MPTGFIGKAGYLSTSGGSDEDERSSMCTTTTTSSNDGETVTEKTQADEWEQQNLEKVPEPSTTCHFQTISWQGAAAADFTAFRASVAGFARYKLEAPVVKVVIPSPPRDTLTAAAGGSGAFHQLEPIYCTNITKFLTNAVFPPGSWLLAGLLATAVTSQREQFGKGTSFLASVAVSLRGLLEQQCARRREWVEQSSSACHGNSWRSSLPWVRSILNEMLDLTETVLRPVARRAAAAARMKTQVQRTVRAPRTGLSDQLLSSVTGELDLIDPVAAAARRVATDAAERMFGASQRRPYGPSQLLNHVHITTVTHADPSHSFVAEGSGASVAFHVEVPEVSSINNMDAAIRREKWRRGTNGPGGLTTEAECTVRENAAFTPSSMFFLGEKLCHEATEHGSFSSSASSTSGRGAVPCDTVLLKADFPRDIIEQGFLATAVAARGIDLILVEEDVCDYTVDACRALGVSLVGGLGASVSYRVCMMLSVVPIPVAVLSQRTSGSTFAGGCTPIFEADEVVEDVMVAVKLDVGRGHVVACGLDARGSRTKSLGVPSHTAVVLCAQSEPVVRRLADAFRSELYDLYYRCDYSRNNKPPQDETDFALLPGRGFVEGLWIAALDDVELVIKTGRTCGRSKDVESEAALRLEAAAVLCGSLREWVDHMYSNMGCDSGGPTSTQQPFGTLLRALMNNDGGNLSESAVWPKGLFQSCADNEDTGDSEAALVKINALGMAARVVLQTASISVLSLSRDAQRSFIFDN